jgi:solute carrier family 25 carnitine/acylcarnitine transporter 20/29
MATKTFSKVDVAAATDLSNPADPYKTLKDCLAGTAGGIGQVLAGQPFDCVKVRLQTQPKGANLYNGALDCAQKTLKNEGARAFYKGTLTPLLGVGACVSIQFGVFGAMKRHFTEKNAGGALKDGQLYVSGGLAGAANSIIVGPVEHIRIRLQAQSDKNRLYNGPLDAARKIYAERGIRSIFRGYGPTIFRESHGTGIYFFTYESLLKWELGNSGRTRDQIPAWKLCTFGAAAGYSMWLTVYPVDVVKSRMQTDGFGAKQVYKNALDCFRQTLAQDGARAFFRGFSPVLVRAAPANAATFLCYEYTRQMLG